MRKYNGKIVEKKGFHGRKLQSMRECQNNNQNGRENPEIMNSCFE